LFEQAGCCGLLWVCGYRYVAARGHDHASFWNGRSHGKERTCPDMSVCPSFIWLFPGWTNIFICHWRSLARLERDVVKLAQANIHEMRNRVRMEGIYDSQLKLASAGCERKA